MGSQDASALRTIERPCLNGNRLAQLNGGIDVPSKRIESLEATHAGMMGAFQNLCCGCAAGVLQVCCGTGSRSTRVILG